MAITDALYGYGERADGRRAASLAIAGALRAICVLDRAVDGHPLQRAWARAEQEFALATAARETGREADPAAILSARLGAIRLPRGHIQLGDLDATARRWAAVAQRKGPEELRRLVRTLAPDRGAPDLAGLAERTLAALGTCTVSSWSLSTDPATGRPTIETASVAAGAIDAGDVALALPFALRRIGLTRSLLPAVTGRNRALASEGDPLANLARWARTLAMQADEGGARLRLLERYVGLVERRLAQVRRPAALRRLVEVGLESWAIWAAGLARRTGVEVSSAWRTLEQAAEMGLVVAVPGQRRSRGDGTLYAAPPWLRLAGLIAAPRGRPPASAPRRVAVPDSGDAMAEADAAVLATDELLARLARPTLHNHTF